LKAFDLLRHLLSQPDIALAVPPGSQFYRLTPQQLESRVHEMSVELALEVSLALVASFEVVLRSDFESRAHDSSANDLLAVRVKAAWKRRGKKTRFEDILDVWKDAHPGSGAGIGEFKKVLNFRHCLAHGRSWQPKGYAGFDANSVVKAARSLQTSVTGFPKLVDW
jgi:hypothetical protein